MNKLLLHHSYAGIQIPKLALGRFIILLAGFFLASALYAEAAGVALVEDYTQFGSSGSDSGRTVVVDANGNYYVAGTVSGSLGNDTNYKGLGDAFVRKYNSEGVLEWSRMIGSNVVDSGSALAIDGAAVYLVGYTEGVVPDGSSVGDRDAFVTRILFDGSIGWTNQFGTVNTDTPFAAVVDGTNLYIVGETNGTFTGETASGGVDGFISSFDTDGTHQWTKQFGTAQDDYMYGVDAEGNAIYVVGTVGGTMSGHTSAGDSDMFIQKMASNGNVTWTKQLGSAGFDFFNDVSIYNGDVYVSGDAEGSIDGQTFSGDIDAVVQKYNSAGTLAWTKQYGSSGLDEAGTIEVDATGVYVGGFVDSALPGFTQIGGDDAYVRKYTTAGALDWTKQFGSVNNEDIIGLAINGSEIVVIGDVNGAMEGEVHLGGRDIYFAILNQDSDGDNIYDDVDTNVLTFSDDFSDGTTTGSIITRGDQTLVVTDATSTTAGVFILAETGGGATPASISTCGIATSTLSAGDTLLVTCGSVTLDVAVGPVETTLFASDGRLANTSLSSGNSLTFTETDATIVVPTTNTQNLVVTVGGETSSFAPGDSGEIPYDAPITIDSMTLSPYAVMVGESVTLEATLTKPIDETSTLTGISYRVDGGSFSGAVSDDGSYDEATESITVNLGSFTAVGVYEVCVKGSDTVGSPSEIGCTILAVYDPAGGYVTGGGQFESPAGAYTTDSSLTGKAHFAFVAEYENGANEPTGNTNFRFKAGDLKFKSTDYDWLVVAGHKAQYKGSGKLNNVDGYRFMLSAVDGELFLAGNKVDSIRMKIWDENSGGVVYDNLLGASEAAEASTALLHGSIVIHD